MPADDEMTTGTVDVSCTAVSDAAAALDASSLKHASSTEMRIAVVGNNEVATFGDNMLVSTGVASVVTTGSNCVVNVGRDSVAHVGDDCVVRAFPASVVNAGERCHILIGGNSRFSAGLGSVVAGLSNGGTSASIMVVDGEHMQPGLVYTLGRHADFSLAALHS